MFSVSSTPTTVTIIYTPNASDQLIFKLRPHEAAELYWKLGESMELVDERHRKR